MLGRRTSLVGALLVVFVTILSPVGSASVVPTHLAPGAPLSAAAPHLVAPSRGAVSATSTVTAADAARIATEQKVLAAVHSSGVPSKDVYLPNFAAPSGLSHNITTPGYSKSPAPVGVATYGVINTTGTAHAIQINSPSWEGQLNITNASVFYLDDDSTDYFGAQLNTILSNVTLFGNASYTFWTQNVIQYSARSHLLQFLDNIWNFSSPAFYLSNNAFYQTSPNGTQVGNTFYYGVGPIINITMPYSLNLFINATVTDLNITNTTTNTSTIMPFDEVFYNYSVYKSGAYVQGGAYDWAIFNSQNLSNATPTIPAPEFQVNGGALTPTGFIPYDAELVLCGPGGGSTTSFYSLDATAQIWYWNTSTLSYQEPPSAYDFGSETGETAQGISEWYDTSHVVHMSAGPTFPESFWNMSPNATPGFVTVNGTVTPSNAFLFLNQSTNLSVPINEEWASWAPVPTSGQIDYQLTPGNYVGEILMSEYDPSYFVLNQSNASTWTINGTLAADPFAGVYTPLYAWNNAQVAWISQSGSGTPSDPYVLENNEYGPLDPIFGGFNDYVFPLFAGIQIVQTTVNIDINSPPTFNVQFSKLLVKLADIYGVPSENNLQIELYGTNGVSVHGDSILTGWISANQQGYPIAELLAWNTTNTLIAANNFVSQGNSLTLYGGTHNTVSGNWFQQNPAPGLENGFAPVGLSLYESGDLVYNNYFATTQSAISPSTTPYTETFISGNSATYTDNWNLSSAEPATWVNTVNGYTLSGSIVGGTWVGGNFWWDLPAGASLPWNESGAIVVGGDYLPLSSPSASLVGSLSFVTSGLPSGASWTLWLNGVSWTTNGSTVTLALANGTYNFVIAPPAGLVATPSSGAVTMIGTDQTVNIALAAPKSGPFDVTFVEIGLPANTNWNVTLAGTLVSSQLQTIVFHEGNGTYPYSIGTVAGYKSTITGGNATVAGAALTVDLTFAAKLGVISGTIDPATATLWIDGATVPVSSAGTFSVNVSVGVHSVEATASGYYPTFNNVTVAAAQSVPLTVSLQSNSGSGSSSSTPGLLAGSNGAVVALLAILVVIFLIGMLYFATRRPPVMMKPESGSDAKSTGSETTERKP